ncbi:MAG TPA: maltose alpha-D-glucosyltransferase [Acidobacteriaceae bacterium]|nr:maltose alpha-D-glucosyltransferase [Acidobacteriaceae bacterium]
MKQAGSAADPLWFKDAIIYELHVKAFADANNDGIGDFQGLLGKLDYLQELGITCIWLLPFFSSPLRDDGYDIADYLTVHPSYGTLEDFQTFLHAAHDRGLQVMIELVVNHTSDQHAWFQRARLAPPGSPERDYYVWSDTDKKYQDARIIFTDTEKSNWTWDPVANAYYWHRFFSHQPDLNYDNPLVMQEVLNIMRFWLDMGVDALRIDAIPYLVERDGTNCENLPETHAVMKRIRAEIDAHYEGRVILAEANQWPADVRPYFGDGDECHMAFHFPLMPRMYMALRQEDRLPITEIMGQTPAIPENCQWGLFLRNHDELTLEMVSEEERDYMYLAYSADPRMRINIGIRRRLAPLLDNNRRRIELLNSILFSFPGTPILYYGDEIGMGDNIYLGDRNGVRTPMQWTADRNAGFSRAVPAKLYSPVVMDPIWGYEAINVEAQQGDSSSLLNWMRNLIALRKLFRVFGRGSLKFLHPSNRKVLAYIREDGGETVLCVANLSRFAQPAQLDLSEYDGMIPVEMLGYVEFPRIGKLPYAVTLAPYGFLWLELHPSQDTVEVQSNEAALMVADGSDWRSLLEGANLRKLEQFILPAYIPRQRWFGNKSSTIAATRIWDWTALEGSGTIICLVEVEYDTGKFDRYLVPLTLAFGSSAQTLRDDAASSILWSALSPAGEGVLYDATYDAAFCQRLLRLISGSAEAAMQHGKLRGSPSSILSGLLVAQKKDDQQGLVPRHGSAEQSNTSVIFGNRLILKLFRHPESGLNPDCEIGRFLTEESRFPNIPPFGGSIEYLREGEEPATLAMLQGLVENQGDGWKWMLEELERYYETYGKEMLPAEEAATLAYRGPIPDGARASAFACDHAGVALQAAAMLGRRTAEMHRALVAPDSATPDLQQSFSAEPLSHEDLLGLQLAINDQATQAYALLRKSMSLLPEDAVEVGAFLLSRRTRTLEDLEQAKSGGSSQAQFETEIYGAKTRIHGDYHLGQVLRVKTDFVILDFEGEPARSLEARRAKHSPLKDVAGMLRSFNYAAWAALMRYSSRRPDDEAHLEPWARLWDYSVSAEFLHSYRETMAGSRLLPANASGFRALLNLYLLQKAFYELLYELNSRPDWVKIPLMGIQSLL